jgi:peptidoglycan L-alanyl-D-glutamate endopeptidase CwlK
VFSDTSLSRLDEIWPELKRRVLNLDSMIPAVNIQVVQGYRTWGEQDILYSYGRLIPGKVVTDARGGYSAHNFGYAVDLCPFDVIPGQPDWNVNHPAWQKMLKAGLACGLAEGATWRTFPDNPHFYPQELPATPTDSMRAMYRSGAVQAVWDSFPTVA